MSNHFKGVAVLLAQMSLACTALYASVVSLWIWSLLILNKQSSSTIPGPLSNQMTTMEHTTNITALKDEMNVSVTEEHTPQQQYLRVTINDINQVVSDAATTSDQQQKKPPSTYSVISLLETVFFLSAAKPLDTGPTTTTNQPKSATSDGGSHKCKNCGRPTTTTSTSQRRLQVPSYTHSTNTGSAHPGVERLNRICRYKDRERDILSSVSGYYTTIGQKIHQFSLRDVTHFHCTMSHSPQYDDNTSPNRPHAFDSRACLTAVAAYLSPA